MPRKRRRNNANEVPAIREAGVVIQRCANNIPNDDGKNNSMRTSAGPIKKRKRPNAQQTTRTSPLPPTTKTQSNIRRILQTLENYANGSNKANFLDFEHIPQLLLSLVASHTDEDQRAVVLACKGIIRFSSGRTGASTCNNLRRRAILPELFGKALRSGGTEHALQAIQKLGYNYWSNATSANDDLLQSTLIHCWKVVSMGIDSGLSQRLLFLIAQACLADLDEMDATKSSLEQHAVLISAILKVLWNAIAELPRDAIASERHAILKMSLSLLSRACVMGVESDPSSSNLALSIIEDILGILVVCAQQRLLLARDFARLVPACNASLSRYVLTHEMDTAHSSIPIKVVQLIEAEDATVGNWLRQTYKIPPMEESKDRLDESRIRLQQQQHQQSKLSSSMQEREQSSKQHTFRSILVAEPDSDEDTSSEDEDCWYDYDEETVNHNGKKV